MPPPELAAPVRAGLSASRPASLGGWGGGPRARVRLSRPASLQELRYAITGADARQGAVARGLGRSYGDAAQLTGGLVLDAMALRRHELDADAGTITVAATVCARPPGLIQYQCVVPRGRETVLARMIERLRPSSVPCFLAVLKLRTGLVSAP